MADNQPQEHFQIQVKTDLTELISVMEWFETLIKSRIPESLLWQCQVAVTEAFTNTVRHAHQNLPSATTIDIEVDFFPNYLEVKIWDWGNPFDLEAKLLSPPPDSAQSWSEEQGRGLYYILKLMDEIEYIRCDQNQRNCLIMRKTLADG